MPVIYKDDETKLKVYRARVLSGKHKFNQWKPNAERWIARYRGKHQTQHTLSLGGHKVSVATGQANIDAMFSSLTAVEIAVAVNNQGHGTFEQARLAERGISETWEEQKVNTKAEYAIKDSLVVGIGWMKVGYDFASHTEMEERPTEDIQEDVDTLFDEAEDSGLEPPDPDAVAATIPLVQEVEVVDRDRVVVDYVPWDEVLVDPTAKRPDDIRWLDHVTKVPADEVRTNEVYRQYVEESGVGVKALEELEADEVLNDDTRGSRDIMAETDEFITVHEMWDFVNGTICTFTESGDFLLNEQVNPLAFMDDLIDRNPFVPLILRTNPDELRGISDMELMEPSLDELEMYRSNLANYLERVKPKLLGPADAFGTAGKEAMESQEWISYVPLENNVNAGEVQPLNPPALPSEVFAMEQRIENHIREATGVSELMRGLFPDRKRTATETSEVVAASSARQAEKRNRLESFYTDIARRILFYMQLFYEGERISRIVDDMGDVEWEWNNEDITFEAALDVELSAKEPKNYQTRKDDAFMIINNLMPLADPSNPAGALVDGAQVLKSALQRLGIDDREIRKWINLPEEQQAEKMANLQDTANQAMAEEGVPPPPDSVPGPLPGPELAGAVNEDIPAELFPGPVDSALARGQYGDGPLDYITGP